jgi:hypothetical protein
VVAATIRIAGIERVSRVGGGQEAVGGAKLEEMLHLRLAFRVSTRWLVATAEVAPNRGGSEMTGSQPLVGGDVLTANPIQLSLCP